MALTPSTWPRLDRPSAGPRPRKLAFALVHAGHRILLDPGERTIGRSSDVEVYVDDMLVSRRHARLLVSHDALFVEDLGSTNGVIVNEEKIAGAVRLQDGDRVIVGTQVLVVSAAEYVSTPTVPPPATPETPKISDLPIEIPPLSPLPTQALHPGFDGSDTLRTEKQDGLLTMARMADRMMVMGRYDAAVRLLGDHLKSVLAKAKEGRAVPLEVLEAIGIYGLKLSDVSQDPTWANVAVELHWLCRRPLPEKAIAMLESGVAADAQLLRFYKAALRDGLERLDREQQALAERILKLPTR